MANTFLDTFANSANFTITLASLASSTAGVGRQSTLIDNSVTRATWARVFVKATTTATTTANSVIGIYLIRGDGTNRDDAAGASDAGFTVKNASLIGTLTTGATTTAQTLQGMFDVYGLGKEWGIALVNGTGAALSSTASDFAASYVAGYISKV
jgi:hypothetical protein